jgi:hypothetical protein
MSRFDKSPFFQNIDLITDDVVKAVFFIVEKTPLRPAEVNWFTSDRLW